MTEKFAAARKAAAKYPTDPINAVLEYAKLSNQLDLIPTGLKKIQDEMLGLLPLYRHPVSSRLAEFSLFFDLDDASFYNRGYQNPAFLSAIEDRGITDALLSTVRDYVRDSEFRTIELAECKAELAEVKDKLTKAETAFKNNRDSDSKKRNADVVQALGLSTGYSPKRYDEKSIWIDYVSLVRWKGLSRKDAVKILRKKYDIISDNSVITSLYNYRKTLYDKIKKDNPSILQNVRKRLRGLIPEIKY